MRKKDRVIRYIVAVLAVGMLLMTACNEEKTKPVKEESKQMVETEESFPTESVVTTENQPETEGIAETEEPKETEEETRVTESAQTLEHFLKTALLPVGSTMYIWGGGWNEEDTGAGPGATTCGVSPAWEEFARGQDATYDYKNHKYEILKGLDCSGYVGWAVYNLWETESGKEGFVYKSTETAEKYSELGFGEFMENPSGFMPGDIVSMKGHVWICLGMCEDKSVVLVHASPPGVSICGTSAGGVESQAVKLAKEYMEKYYPAWQETYPDRAVGEKYVNQVSVMRWSAETLPDADKLQAMTAEEILKRLFEE